MTDHSMERLRAAISNAMFDRQTDATALARALSRGKDYVRDFLDGRKKTLPLQVVMQIEKILELPDGVLTSNVEYVEFDGKTLVKSSDQMDGDVGFQKIVKIPIWHWHDALDGTLTNRKMGMSEVHAPYFLSGSKRPYGMIVEGDGMEPAYEAGDTIFLDESKSLRKNIDVVIYKKGEDFTEPGNIVGVETRCVIRRLVSYDAHSWTARQLNPLADEILSREQWPGAVRIVGRVHRI